MKPTPAPKYAAWVHPIKAPVVVGTGNGAVPVHFARILLRSRGCSAINAQPSSSRNGAAIAKAWGELSDLSGR